MEIAFLIIALGFGFKIFAEATEKSKKSLKQLGRFVGVLMMIVSAAGIACTIVCAAKCAKMKCDGNFYSKKAMCPLSGNKIEKMGDKTVELN